MTYTLKDLKHLEVMADLLNANPVEPEQINLTELLSFDKVEHKPTIDEKILTLCSILRSSGFDKQADGLENKFAIYKAANTHMYRAIDEDGEDLVDFAHPDGDKNMGEASDNLGDVETIVSRHKKMVDVVNKMPKGKLASYVDQVKKALQKSALLVPLAAWIWSKTNRINQGIDKNTDILLDEIADIEDSDQIKRSVEAIAVIDTIKSHLTELKTISNTYTKILNPTDKDMEFINGYGKFIVTVVEPELKKLDGMMVKIRKANESTILPNIYHSFVASDFEDVQKAIRGLWSSLLEMTSGIASAKKEHAAAKQRETVPATDPSLLAYDPNSTEEEEDKVENSKAVREPISVERSSVQAEVAKLNEWKVKLLKKQMDESNKKHINNWLDGQLKELSVAKTPEAINKIIEEDKRFEAKGLI